MIDFADGENNTQFLRVVLFTIQHKRRIMET